MRPPTPSHLTPTQTCPGRTRFQIDSPLVIWNSTIKLWQTLLKFTFTWTITHDTCTLFLLALYRLPLYRLPLYRVGTVSQITLKGVMRPPTPSHLTLLRLVQVELYSKLIHHWSQWWNSTSHVWEWILYTSPAVIIMNLSRCNLIPNEFEEHYTVHLLIQ